MQAEGQRQPVSADFPAIWPRAGQLCRVVAPLRSLSRRSRVFEARVRPSTLNRTRLEERLATCCLPGHALAVEPEALIHRDEVAAMLFAIADINENVWAIRELLEEDDGGEEGLPEDDT